MQLVEASEARPQPSGTRPPSEARPVWLQGSLDSRRGCSCVLLKERLPCGLRGFLITPVQPMSFLVFLLSGVLWGREKKLRKSMTEIAMVWRLHTLVIINHIRGGKQASVQAEVWLLKQTICQTLEQSFDSVWGHPSSTLNQLSALHPFATCRHY